MNLKVLKNSKYIILLLISILAYNCQESNTGHGAYRAFQEEALISFSKLYGYVKYFHPSDASVTIDWDALAIYGSKRMVEAQNSKEVENALSEIFLPIAPSLIITDKQESAPPYTLNWLNDSLSYDTIYWQHRGFGNRSANGYYRSQRVRRIDSIKPFKGSAYHYLKYSGEKVKGKQIKMEVKIKSEMANASSFNTFSFYYKDSNRHWFPFEKLKLFSKNEWTTLSSEVFLPENTIEIGVRHVMYGIGKAYFDDLKIYVNNNQSWELLSDEGFEGDDAQALEFKNTHILGDYSTFNGNDLYTAFEATEESYSGGKSLCFYSISAKGRAFDFDLKPKDERITFTEDIGLGLTIHMPIMLPGDTSNTFPLTNTAKLKSLQDSLKSIEINESDVYTRMGVIINLWNVMQHFYPYLKNLNWSDQLKTTLQITQEDQTREDFFKTIKLMLSELKDGHSEVVDLLEPTPYYPSFGFERINDTLVVTTIYNDSIDLLRGDIISKINNRDALTLFKENLKLNIKSTKSSSELSTTFSILEGRRNEKMEVTIQDGITTKNLVVNRNVRISQYFEKYNIDSDPAFNITKDITYINMTNISYEDFEPGLDSIKDNKAIIFDLRGGPSYNIHQFINHLLSFPDTVSNNFRIPRVVEPNGISDFTEKGWGLQPALPHISSKCYLLVNAKAQSYSESVIAFFDHYGLATLVGERTAGINGNINTFLLPTGISITFTGMKTVKHDGSQLFGIGFEPDVPVQRTIKGIREGRDEILEKAIELAKHHVDSLNAVN